MQQIANWLEKLSLRQTTYSITVRDHFLFSSTRFTHLTLWGWQAIPWSSYSRRLIDRARS